MGPSVKFVSRINGSFSKKILWGNFVLVQGGFGKIPHFSRFFFRTPSLMYDITLGPHEEFYGTVSII